MNVEVPVFTLRSEHPNRTVLIGLNDYRSTFTPEHQTTWFSVFFLVLHREKERSRNADHEQKTTRDVLAYFVEDETTETVAVKSEKAKLPARSPPSTLDRQITHGNREPTSLVLRRAGESIAIQNEFSIVSRTTGG